jgi:O-antigen/teichoic acid export membrane protein
MSVSVRNVIKHTGVFGLGALLGRAVGFIMLPFYAHMLGQTGYAIIGMMDVALGVLVCLLAYGFESVLIRLYHSQNQSLKHQVISTGMILASAISLCFLFVIVPFAQPLSKFILGNEQYTKIVVIVMFSFSFETIGQCGRAWLLIQKRSVLFTTLSLLRLVVALSLNIWLIVIKNIGVEGYFISALVTNIIFGIVFVGIAVKECGISFNKTIAIEIRDFLLPLIPGSFATYFSLQAERMLTRSILGLNAVGILEMGYKIPMLIPTLITMPFINSWNTRRFEIANDIGAPRAIGRMYTYYLFLATMFGLLLAVTVKPLLELMAPPEFSFSYRIARLEILLYIIQGSVFHVSFGLYYAKHTGIITKIRAVVSVIKITLSWYFISTWGLYGAVYSAVIANAITFILTIIYSQQRYRIAYEWGKILVIIFTAAIFFSVISKWEVNGSAAFVIVDGKIFPYLSKALGSTYLNTWKNGIILEYLADQSYLFSDIVIRGLASLSYCCIFPLIHRKYR